MNDVRNSMIRHLAIGVVGACICAVAVFASEALAESDAVPDLDTVPRIVGGSGTIGGGADMLVIPSALPGKENAMGRTRFVGDLRSSCEVVSEPLAFNRCGPWYQYRSVCPDRHSGIEH